MNPHYSPQSLFKMVSDVNCLYLTQTDSVFVVYSLLSHLVLLNKLKDINLIISTQ